MRVLLISPLRNIDPASGDNVYTETLLAEPPPGVEYEDYSQALARGNLVEHARRDSLRAAWRNRKARWRETWMTAVCKAANLLRKAGFLFWEPFRIFSVRAGHYDLVHIHSFSCGFLEIDCPLLVSNALAARYLYTDARGYSWLRVRLAEAVELILGRLLRVNVNSYFLPGAKRVMAFSEDLRQWYVARKIVPAESVDIVPIYLPSSPAASTPAWSRCIGFVAKDFEAKGGNTLLEAFLKVREAIPEAELIIVGSPPKLSEAEQSARGIRWLPLVERKQLLEEILPSFDVFAYPTQFDGMPLVVLEAMCRGIATASTLYRAIPEMLDHGRAGLLSPVGDAAGLAKNLVRLLDPAMNQTFRSAARDYFERTYSADVVRNKLLSCYRATIES